MSDFYHLSRAVVELMTSFQTSPHGVQKGNGSFTWRPPYSLGKVRRQAAVLRPIIQASSYALSHRAVRVLKSASGHRMRGAEKESSDGSWRAGT